MEKVINQSHNGNTLFFASSRFFERAAYYGLRSLIVLYMINESIVTDQTSVYAIYGWFTSSIVLTQIVGAAIGDLLVGNKWAIILGAILQSLGALSFCTNELYGVYVGLALVSIGAGLYGPNIEARYGKMYLDRKKLLDAAFVILFLAANLGAALGTVGLGILGESYGWSIAFIGAAVCFVLSLLLFALSKEKIRYHVVPAESCFNKYILAAVGLLAAISIFWTVTEIAHIKHSAFQFAEGMWEIPSSLMQSMDAIFFLPLSIIIIVLWSKIYRKPMFKIGVGFLFGLCAFTLLYFIPETFTSSTIGLYVFALFLLSIAELYIQPVIQSYLVRVSNPKYLAIVLSIAFVPGRFLANKLAYTGGYFIDNSQLGIIISIVVAALLVGVMFFAFYSKRKSVN